ncbi:hypothetical protein CDV50_01255 [Haematobacter massiliensis]|uniref:Uncharacterized protein n=1 Tax=Haematobacter massiliensis TaxID=195105 RepID=A0A086XXM9_9RHOB|nr:hypothetical protein CN97_02545 [Haematobacter massiliensis]OWJ73859.1 hypothetical protein CDV50_01255 [Haematobacter massiliensis]OWJ87594.1 hypothetical protein CDV51_05435 [Haematobacter massiliensis]
MLANTLIEDGNISDIAQHRCFGCLTGGDAGKRACAIRQLFAEGIAAERLETLAASSKTAH